MRSWLPAFALDRMRPVYITYVNKSIMGIVLCILRPLSFAI